MTDPKFMTPPHRRAYLTHLNRCKVMDSYHRALIYALTAVPALRYNIDACFNFEKDEIKPESLAAGWQTSGTTKLTRFAYCSILSLERDSNNYYFIIRGATQ